MKRIHSDSNSGTGLGISADNSSTGRRPFRFPLSGGVNRHARAGATLRIAFLSSLLAGPPVIHAQSLSLLDTLPVTVMASKFVGAGDGRRFAFSALTADRGFVNVGLAPAELNLKSHTSAPRSPNSSQFVMFLQAYNDPKTMLMINLVATKRRCLSTIIDPILNQASLPGRIIEVSSVLLTMAPILAKSDSAVSLCTMDSGKLTLDFSTPGFDMVQMTAISYGTPSNVLRAMNTQSTMIYFPTSKF